MRARRRPAATPSQLRRQPGYTGAEPRASYSEDHPEPADAGRDGVPAGAGERPAVAGPGRRRARGGALSIVAWPSPPLLSPWLPPRWLRSRWSAQGTALRPRQRYRRSPPGDRHGHRGVVTVPDHLRYGRGVSRYRSARLPPSPPRSRRARPRRRSTSAPLPACGGPRAPCPARDAAPPRRRYGWTSRRPRCRRSPMTGPAHIGPDAPADSGQRARQQAIQQIKARRRFKISTASAAAGVTLLVPIWAATEYWP